MFFFWWVHWQRAASAADKGFCLRSNQENGQTAVRILAFTQRSRPRTHVHRDDALFVGNKWEQKGEMCWNRIELRRGVTIGMGSAGSPWNRMSRCRWDSFKRAVFCAKVGGGKWEQQLPSARVFPSSPLAYTDLLVKAVDKGELRDRIWEIVDVDSAGLQLITHVRHIFVHFVIFKVQLLFHKRWLHFLFSNSLSTFLYFF